MDTVKFDADAATDFLMTQYHRVPGWIQIVDSSHNYTGQVFTTEAAGIDKAVSYAAYRDSWDAPTGIYFRATTMTSRPEKGRGGADLTKSVPLLWADLDYGEAGHKRPPINPATGKEQLPNPPTQEDAHGLIAAAGLPEPTVLVHSGGGLYPLWVLDRVVDTTLAAQLSEGIQDAILRASNDRGWHYGSGVSDLARVLRLPGSVNRKVADNPRPCRVIGGIA